MRRIGLATALTLLAAAQVPSVTAAPLRADRDVLAPKKRRPRELPPPIVCLPETRQPQVQNRAWRRQQARKEKKL